MSQKIDNFIETIAKLRAPDGCPWDREQDHKSLARYLLEETYEVLEAIHANEPEKLKEELGDLLLQIVLHAQIAKEKNEFDMDSIANTINIKMINRHPHVFGEDKLNNSEEVIQQWEEIKKQEKLKKSLEHTNDTTEKNSIVDDVPKALPALLKALKVSEKAVSEGFEWSNFNELWQKVESELQELKEAIEESKSTKQKSEIELELGDVFFCLVNVARWQKLNPEESLLLGIEKFRKRYRKMESLSNTPLKEKNSDELLKLWQEAKKLTNSSL